jgi:hypothetical protein
MLLRRLGFRLLDAPMRFVMRLDVLFPDNHMRSNSLAISKLGHLNMPPTQDLTGRKFGEITILSRSHKNKAGGWVWSGQCSCGKKVFRSSADLNRGNKRHLGRQNCGCLRLPHLLEALGREHHNRTGTKEHNIWRSMISRCTHNSLGRRKNYIERGIKVCDRWANSFSDFLSDMGPIPEGLDSIDRIENDEGYEPGNCRWANADIQMNNRRCCVYIDYQGERLTIAQWARRFNMTRGKLWKRLKRGVPFEQAIT